MPITNYYVDPAINADSGTGTIGDPFGDLQYGLNTVTRDGTNGDQFNVKAGTAEVLAAPLTLATYGTPTAAAPLVLRGYTAVANDGGVGEINCGGATMWAATIYDFVICTDLEMHTFGDNHGVFLDTYTTLHRCEIHKGASAPSGKYLVIIGANSKLAGCHIHDAGTNGWGVNGGASLVAIGNYIANCPSYSIYASGALSVIRRNIVLCQATSAIGIRLNQFMSEASENVVYNTTAGITQGILSTSWRNTIMNNIICGFSGASGDGIEATDLLDTLGYNAFYNNTADKTLANVALDLGNDVALAADPFVDAANGNFALTDAAKLALRSAGWPASYLGAHASTITNLNIGPIQMAAGAAAAARGRIIGG